MLTVCVPTLKRYDLLKKLLLSLERSTLRPAVFVIDNGRNANRRNAAIGVSPLEVHVYVPEEPMGVAASWNWFLDNVPEERVISNDDIEFAPGSLEAMVASPASLVWASGFSCFLIRDECVAKVGRFDETISPGYGYYEDDDYLQRLDGRGTRGRASTAENVECGVVHHHSQTLKVASSAEYEEHHRKMRIAQQNYMQKWGLKSL